MTNSYERMTGRSNVQMGFAFALTSGNVLFLFRCGQANRLSGRYVQQRRRPSCGRGLSELYRRRFLQQDGHDNNVRAVQSRFLLPRALNQREAGGMPARSLLPARDIPPVPLPVRTLFKRHGTDECRRMHQVPARVLLRRRGQDQPEGRVRSWVLLPRGAECQQPLLLPCRKTLPRRKC